MRDAELRITARSRLEDVALLGVAARAVCATAELAPAQLHEVELAVVEAATNCVKHAYAGLEAGPVELLVALRADRVELEVSDWGSAMEAGRLEAADDLPWDRTSDVSEIGEGGMGLFLIRKVMDEVAYASDAGRNTLRMVKRRERGRC